MEQNPENDLQIPHITLGKKRSVFSNPSLYLDSVVVDIENKSSIWSPLSAAKLGPFTVEESRLVSSFESSNSPNASAGNGTRSILCRSLENYLSCSVIYDTDVRANVVLESFFLRRDYGLSSLLPPHYGNRSPKKPLALYLDGQIRPLRYLNVYRCYYYHTLVQQTSAFRELKDLGLKGQHILIVDSGFRASDCGREIGPTDIRNSILRYGEEGTKIPTSLLLASILKGIQYQEYRNLLNTR